MKNLFTTKLALLLSLSISLSAVANDVEEVAAATGDLISEVMKEYHLEVADDCEETQDVTIVVEFQNDNTPPVVIPPRREGMLKEGVFGGGKPYVGMGLSSNRLGLFHVQAGFDTKYISTDITLGFLGYNGKAEYTYMPVNDNMKAVDTGARRRTYSVVSNSVSAALRVRLTRYIEVGARYMVPLHSYRASQSDEDYFNKGITEDKRWSEDDLLGADFKSSLRQLGYDVRFIIPFEKGKSSGVTITLSGLKKNSFVPNYIQLGVKVRLDE